jgi:chromosome partitioning protein
MYKPIPVRYYPRILVDRGTRMRVITFVTQKGGSGKSTLAFCCGVRAEETGKRVLLLDMDPQATTELWYQDREAERPRLARINPADLDQALKGALRERFDYVLIDTPGRDEPATAAAIRASHFCLIPCRPTPGDMKATPATVGTIKRLGKPAAFVLTQTPPRGSRIIEADKGLGMLGMVAPVRIVQRSAYQDAQGMGLGVTEYEPDGKAATEIKELWSWIVRKMEKVIHESQADVA